MGEQLISQDDLDAKDHFPEAQDWLDIGRRRLRHALGKLEQRLLTQYAKKVEYPCSTEAAFYLAGSLGYQATRKNFDYFIRHGHMESPKRDGRQLAWSRENVVEFAMQLERMRYWSVGRHDEKKTVWELQAEMDQSAPARDKALQTKIDASNADQLLEMMVGTDGKNGRNIRAYITGYYCIRLWESDLQLDSTGEELLDQLVNEGDLSARQAVAITIKRRLTKRTE